MGAVYMNACDFIMNEIKKQRIAVIGDIMLDRYFYGNVTRISPEAPVPVNRIYKMKSVLGGAANVAANLAKLGCQVFIGGVTGDDENLPLIKQLMDELSINNQGLVVSSHRKTITKIRVLGGQQQMLRMDFEETGELLSDESYALKAWFSELLDEGLDGVIISDYAKGVCANDFCQWVIKEAHYQNIPVLVDPKGDNWNKYTGCDFITPNLKELGDISGKTIPNEDTIVVDVAQDIRKSYSIQNIVVTRSEKGITVVNDDGVIHNPATAKEVFDVSGAGDTVAATLMACIAGKQSLADSIYVANRAAGIVVGKVGTYPVSGQELIDSVIEDV